MRYALRLLPREFSSHHALSYNRNNVKMTIPGKVYLIGAGPGDPGLITVKGLECVKKADVIIYDYLANERILDHRRPDAELIYVGKQGSRHTLPQN